MAENFYRKIYTDESLDEYLKHLNHRWLISDNGQVMKHEFRFSNFSEAMKFVNHVADLAEKNNHHPNLHIFYDKVLVELSTHEAQKLTDKDFSLAKKIEEILK